MAAGTRLAWLVEERKRPSILSKVNDLTILHEFFFSSHSYLFICTGKGLWYNVTELAQLLVIFGGVKGG